jgi:hypothetical protein
VLCTEQKHEAKTIGKPGIAAEIESRYFLGDCRPGILPGPVFQGLGVPQVLQQEVAPVIHIRIQLDIFSAASSPGSDVLIRMAPCSSVTARCFKLKLSSGSFR